MTNFTDATTDHLLTVLPCISIPRASEQVASARTLIIGGSIGGLASACCLHASGFTDVTVIERSGNNVAGAGLGLDDASIGILKGLGIIGGHKQPTLQRMRWTEERLASGEVVLRQPFPYFATQYTDLRTSLKASLPAGCQKIGQAVDLQSLDSTDQVSVKFDSGLTEEFDLVILADGPRSLLRSKIMPACKGLRFAGYTALRGVAFADMLPAHVLSAFRNAFPHFGNCLYFVLAEDPRQHCVVYSIGHGIINWLVYENHDQPVAGPGQTTSAASMADIAQVRCRAKQVWGEELGAVIEATPDPFWNDIYDLLEPLPAMATQRVVLVGDCAHAITPHMAKGSNLAIHDAFALACSASSAADIPTMLRTYCESRTQECARMLLLSRHMGRLRNGMFPGSEKLPNDAAAFTALVRKAGLATATLPHDVHFDDVWEFAESLLQADEKGFLLERPVRSASSVWMSKL